MMAIPNIAVQLVHIQGPLKGEIQEFSESEILIGRHPDCQVIFPKDLVTLSRVHARIVKEGNRFKLVDQSTNGTFVNGQKISEVYLKDGDVVMFAEGGPKVSFLTRADAKAASSTGRKTEEPLQRMQAPAGLEPAPAARVSPPARPFSPSATSGLPRPSAPPPVQPQPAGPGPAGGQEKIKAPFAIQYGPMVKSFQTLPIVIGKGPSCDFGIPHPGLSDKHAQILFARSQYWIKDLTGTGAITINGQPVTSQAPLEPDAHIALCSGGPKFRFIGGGRLVEIEEDSGTQPPPSSRPSQPPPRPDSKSEGSRQKSGGLFKKFFS